MQAAVRAVLALLLIGLAAWLAWNSLGPLHNLWVEDGGDNHPVAYVVSALPFIGLALLCLAGAVFVSRRGS